MTYYGSRQAAAQAIVAEGEAGVGRDYPKGADAGLEDAEHPATGGLLEGDQEPAGFRPRPRDRRPESLSTFRKDLADDRHKTVGSRHRKRAVRAKRTRWRYLAIVVQPGWQTHRIGKP